MVSSKILQIIRFKNIEQWDVKYFFGIKIKSKYKVENIGKYINRQNEKIKLFEYPEEKFHILGISNEIGMFDAYSEFGKNINQSYILVKKWLFSI